MEKQQHQWEEEEDHADEEEFFSFPRTPHLGAGSEVVDDDQVLPLETAMASLVALLLQEPSGSGHPAPGQKHQTTGKKANAGSHQQQRGGVGLVVQEKVDGTNVSIYFKDPYVPVLQKRSGLITTGEQRQYEVFRSWAYENMEMLFSVLGSRQYVLFGEWLWCAHGVKYDALPSYFLAFDMFHIPTRRFLSYDSMSRLLQGKVHTVPLIWEYKAYNNNNNTTTTRPEDRKQQPAKCSSNNNAAATAFACMEELKKQVAEDSLRRKSAFGQELQEGLYVRLEKDGFVCDRFKVRRKTFTPGRANFRSVVINNRLLPSSSSIT